MSGMRDILWRKDAMCDTIKRITVPKAWQDEQGQFKYVMPCYVLPRDTAGPCHVLPTDISRACIEKKKKKKNVSPCMGTVYGRGTMRKDLHRQF